MTDEPEIIELWQTMATAWEQGDAEAFARVFTEDVDFVTTQAEELQGRAQVADRHATLFTSVFADTHLEPEVRLIRPLADGTYLVHALSTIVPLGIRTHALAVVVAQSGQWSITAFHNMLV